MTYEHTIAILSILIELKARTGEIDQHDAIKRALSALIEKHEREKRGTK